VQYGLIKNTRERRYEIVSSYPIRFLFGCDVFCGLCSSCEIIQWIEVWFSSTLLKYSYCLYPTSAIQERGRKIQTRL